jgi:hypothetical protein
MTAVHPIWTFETIDAGVPPFPMRATIKHSLTNWRYDRERVHTRLISRI